MSRAQAEAVVDMLNSNTMDFSDPGKQRERMIELVEAALAEHAKAAPVSDVGALVERLREVASAGCSHDMGFDRELGPMGCDLEFEGKGGCFCAGMVPIMREAAAALISTQEEAAGLRVERDELAKTLDPGTPPHLVSRIILNSIENLVRAETAESKLADAVGETRAAHKNFIDAWEALPGGRNCDIREVERWLAAYMKPAVDRARASIKETGDAR